MASSPGNHRARLVACASLRGVPAHTATWIHDVFNIVCLFTLDILNLMNWRFDRAAWAALSITDGPASWAGRWSGDYQDLLLVAIFTYMVVDSIFVLVLPQTVKIPMAIIMHHCVCIAAMTIPWQHGDTHGYTLGIFMMADFNTLFLLLRNTLRKRAKAPLPRVVHWGVSACFYVTWVVVRLILYPVWLFTVSWPEWMAAWERTGSGMNLFLVMPFSNFFAVFLNFKWTWDILAKWSRSRKGRDAGCPDSLEGTGLEEPLLRKAATCTERRPVGLDEP